jgi:hypothetical protein
VQEREGTHPFRAAPSRRRRCGERFALEPDGSR